MNMIENMLYNYSFHFDSYGQNGSNVMVHDLLSFSSETTEPESEVHRFVCISLNAKRMLLYSCCFILSVLRCLEVRQTKTNKVQVMGVVIRGHRDPQTQTSISISGQRKIYLLHLKSLIGRWP